MRKGFLVLSILLVIAIYGCAQTQTSGTIAEELPKAGEQQPEPEAQTAVEEPGPKSKQPDAETEATTKEISVEELSKHDNEDDCWVVYEGKVYDFTNARMHPNMAKTFYRHCGQVSGFEEGAKARHSGSSEDRVENFGEFVGVLK